jgi:hypothetical protein
MKYVIEEYGGGMVCLLLGSAIIRILQEIVTMISSY